MADARARRILAALRREYPPKEAFLRWETPFQLLVAVMLSARTTDVATNRVTEGLFRAYPTAEAAARADARRLERLLHGVSYPGSKARHLRATARILVERHGGEPPRTLEELVDLPGVGRKTANVVLSYLEEPAAGVAVDTHVARLSRRLALTESASPARIERDLMAAFPRRDWHDLNYYFIRHGRAICVARRPRCGRCVLDALCPKAGVTETAEGPAP